MRKKRQYRGPVGPLLGDRGQAQPAIDVLFPAGSFSIQVSKARASGEGLHLILSELLKLRVTLRLTWTAGPMPGARAKVGGL